MGCKIDCVNPCFKYIKSAIEVPGYENICDISVFERVKTINYNESFNEKSKQVQHLKKKLVILV